MTDYQDFTIDKNRYDLNDFKEVKSTENIRFVPIIDGGIALGNNSAHNQGL